MSSIPQTTENGNSVSDFATKFMKRFHLGRLLFKCNAGKEKGIPVMDVFRFLFCMMFSDRSFYMQMKTGTFGAGFSKNTIYRFLNNARTNWQRFTTLLSASIINGFMKSLTDEKRKDVFIVDDSLFDRSRSKKVELLARVFDHCSMKYRSGFRMLTPLAGRTGTPLCQSATACFPLRRIRTSFVKGRLMTDAPLLEGDAGRRAAKLRMSWWN